VGISAAIGSVLASPTRVLAANPKCILALGGPLFAGAGSKLVSNLI